MTESSLMQYTRMGALARLAVPLLENCVSIETVSVLLGHSNINIAPTYYRRWARSFQDKLERKVARAWRS
jgi:hypothetical protein